MVVKVGKRKVSVKHQVVLPEAIMAALGVTVGDQVEFLLNGDKVVIVKADDAKYQMGHE